MTSSHCTHSFSHHLGFSNNFENALNTISACKKQQPTFQLYLKHCVDTVPACGKLWLEDHLITPIQRIPRLIMLLKDLIKRTDASHPDFPFLTKSRAEMEVIALHVNNSKKIADSNLKLIEIQTTVKRCPRIVDPARIFVRFSVFDFDF